MRELHEAGVDSVMLSWWGRGDTDIGRDSQGVNTDPLVPVVLDAAAAVGMRVSWHLEPYGGRSPRTILDDLRYLHERCAACPCTRGAPHALASSKWKWTG